jgi:hypothetical protein
MRLSLGAAQLQAAVQRWMAGRLQNGSANEGQSPPRTGAPRHIARGLESKHVIDAVRNHQKLLSCEPWPVISQMLKDDAAAVTATP